jgi:hypothetical protein
LKKTFDDQAFVTVAQLMAFTKPTKAPLCLFAHVVVYILMGHALPMGTRRYLTAFLVPICVSQCVSTSTHCGTKKNIQDQTCLVLTRQAFLDVYGLCSVFVLAAALHPIRFANLQKIVAVQ